MAKTERRLSYEEFVERLPDILDELAHTHDTLVIEKDGAAFRISPAVEITKTPWGPPWSPLPDSGLTRKGLKRSAGALKGVNREELMADLRRQRQQD